MYIFGPPGWSPDNSSLTAKQIQELYYAGKISADMQFEGVSLEKELSSIKEESSNKKESSEKAA